MKPGSRGSRASRLRADLKPAFRREIAVSSTGGEGTPESPVIVLVGRAAEQAATMLVERALRGGVRLRPAAGRLAYSWCTGAGAGWRPAACCTVLLAGRWGCCGRSAAGRSRTGRGCGAGAWSLRACGRSRLRRGAPSGSPASSRAGGGAAGWPRACSMMRWPGSGSSSTRGMRGRDEPPPRPAAG